MFLLVLSIVVLSLSTLAVIGIVDAGRRLRQFEEEITSMSPAEGDSLNVSDAGRQEFSSNEIDAADTARFTSSLLGAIEAHSSQVEDRQEAVPQGAKVSESD